MLTKKTKWQFHKNPEAGSTDHPEADLTGQPAVVVSTKEDSTGTNLVRVEKPNIVSIILSGFRRFALLATM